MDTAYSGLERILGDVRRKTGVDAYLTPRGGEETPIFVNWKGRAVTLYLGGRGESAEREAKLVGYLLSDAEETQDSSPAKLLLGDSDKAYRLLAKYGIADGECCALDICPEKRSQDALEHIERAAEPFGFALRAEDGHIAAVKFTADGQTGYEFAQFLLQSLYEEAGIRARIGLGCDVASFEEISLSYGQAVAATRIRRMLSGCSACCGVTLNPSAAHLNRAGI